MRKGEIAKIRISKLHGFGRLIREDELIFPEGFNIEGSKGKNRLKKKK